MVKPRDNEKGYILALAMMLISVMLTLVAASFHTTKVELATTKSTRDAIAGFYAAEAGLNLRAEAIRQEFVGYNVPSGTSPVDPSPCIGANQGSGSFACQSYTIGNRNVLTYVISDPANPVQTTVPQGERYQYLNAQEYRYTTRSIATNVQDSVEAILELRFVSRLIPMFQFMAFYNKDLEILPGPSMTLNGPLHTNGDLYLNTDHAATGLRITGQITTANDLYRGRKNTNVCLSNPVDIRDPLNYRRLVPTCSTRTLVDPANISPWNGMIQIGFDPVTVPDPEEFEPNPANTYFHLADLRLALQLDASDAPNTSLSTTGITVLDSAGNIDSSATTALHGCSGSLGGRPIATNTFLNNREARTIRVLDVDLQALFNCLHTTNWFGSGKLLSDATEGGLVFHTTVFGPNSSGVNGYGVRVRNGATLAASVAGAPAIRGLTIVSDQGFYVMGNYNSANWKPAAFLVDVWNVLSGNWNDGVSAYASRTVSANMTIQAAVLSGTDTTGGVEGASGQGGAYNGGLENFPRFHEQWSGRTLTYVGSLVSLSNARHANGAWVYGSPIYTAPTRNWSYDTRFNNPANLPPLSPRFVMLKQEMFLRDYEQ